MIRQLPFSPDIASMWLTCYTQSTLQVPFYAFAWQEVYFSTLGKTETPEILHLPNLNIITPFIVKESQIEFAGGVEVSDYMDLVGPDDHKSQAWQEILDYCKENDIKHLTLHNVPQSSATLTFFQKLAETNFANVKISPEDTTPILKLPKSYPEYIESLERKSRHELERKLRKFQREHPQHEIKISQQPDVDIEILFKLMLQDDTKKQFLTDAMKQFFNKLVQSFRDRIILQILYVNQIPVAAILAFTISESFLLYNSGFDPTRFSGSGFFLKVASIRYAIEKGFTEYNFLQGRERYKYDLGGQDFRVYKIEVMYTPGVYQLDT